MQALIYLLFSCRISSAGPNKPLPASSREGSEIRNTYPSHVSEAPITVKKLKTLEGYVGFANLPNQVYRKAVKKGFEFTLMVWRIRIREIYVNQFNVSNRRIQSASTWSIS